MWNLLEDGRQTPISWTPARFPAARPGQGAKSSLVRACADVVRRTGKRRERGRGGRVHGGGLGGSTVAEGSGRGGDQRSLDFRLILVYDVHLISQLSEVENNRPLLIFIPKGILGISRH